MTFAERLFDGSSAECELEDKLDSVGILFERLSWDSYDCSLEIKEVPVHYRLSSEAQEVIHQAGFSKVYVNHIDGWETHYSFSGGEFKAKDGWRVCYPHKRGEDPSQDIWVEKTVEGWPKEWFDSGYAVVKEVAK